MVDLGVLLGRANRRELDLSLELEEEEGGGGLVKDDGG